MTPLISRALMDHRPQEIGKIKLGGRGQKKKTSGGAEMYLPERFDHFEIVTRARSGGDGAFVRDEAVHAVIGDEPRELEAILMYPEIEDNLLTEMVEYGGKRPKVKCNGEVQITANGVESPCSKMMGDSCACRPYCRLQVQLVASPHVGGRYVFRTRSWESTNNIQTFLEEIYQTFGTLYQAPVKLICYQSEDHYEVSGKEMVGKSWKVAMVLNMTYERAALHMAEAHERLGAIKERLRLTAGQAREELDRMDEDEADEIADEFSPPKELDASVATQEGLDEVVEGLRPVEPPAPPREAEVGEIEGGVEDVAEELISLREKARRVEDLLDATAEQFIADALESRDAREMKKAIKALNRRFASLEG